MVERGFADAAEKTRRVPRGVVNGHQILVSDWLQTAHARDHHCSQSGKGSFKS